MKNNAEASRTFLAEFKDVFSHDVRRVAAAFSARVRRTFLPNEKLQRILKMALVDLNIVSERIKNAERASGGGGAAGFGAQTPRTSAMAALGKFMSQRSMSNLESATGMGGETVGGGGSGLILFLDSSRGGCEVDEGRLFERRRGDKGRHKDSFNKGFKDKPQEAALPCVLLTAAGSLRRGWSSSAARRRWGRARR